MAKNPIPQLHAGQSERGNKEYQTINPNSFLSKSIIFIKRKPMDVYSKKVEIRWSDLDPNFHLRHSVYYDWGAYTRISFLSEASVIRSVSIFWES